MFGYLLVKSIAGLPATIEYQSSKRGSVTGFG